MSKNKNVLKIYKKLNIAIQGNFSQLERILAIVSNINSDYFTIKTKESDLKLKCVTDKSIEDLNVDDEIIVYGWLKLDEKDFNVYLLVEQYYHLSEFDKLDILEKPYRDISRTLKKEIYNKIINSIKNTPVPSTLFNIGLITFPESDVDSFKCLFELKCYGKLLIYESDYSISIPIEYFKKYHNIDLIILLTNNFDRTQVYNISTLENVKYLIREKQPYILSINNSQEVFPLTNVLSNMITNTIEETIEIIYQIQTKSINDIKNAINNGRKHIMNMLQKKKEELLKLQLYSVEFGDSRFMTINKGNNSCRIKELLMMKINEYFGELCDVQNNIMRSIIEDDRVKETYSPIIESEKKFMDQLDETNDTIIIEKSILHDLDESLI